MSHISIFFWGVYNEPYDKSDFKYGSYVLILPCPPQPKAQETAASAVAWCTSLGGHVPKSDLVGRISNIGANGRHKGNIERDCETLINTFGKRFGVTISTTPVRMWNPGESRIEVKHLPLIYPDDFATAVWKRSPALFRQLLLGDGGVREYWEHCRNFCDWFKTHPSYHHPNKWDNMVPLALYGDDVQTYRNSECGAMSILAWSSDMGTINSFKSRYFLITAFSEYEECAYTFNDIMSAVSKRITQMVTPSLARQQGYPWLKDEYSFMLSSLQGDLVWVVQHYGDLFNFRKNDFCGYCHCVKKHELMGMTLADFSASALHRSTKRVYQQDDLVNRLSS